MTKFFPTGPRPVTSVTVAATDAKRRAQGIRAREEAMTSITRRADHATDVQSASRIISTAGFVADEKGRTR